MNWQAVVVYIATLTLVGVMTYFGKPTEALLAAVAGQSLQAFQHPVTKNDP